MNVTVSRRAHFNAAHRLHRPDWSTEKNVAVFGTEWEVWEQESWCECNYSLEEWMTLLDKHSISWCQWSLFDKDEKSIDW